MTQITMTQLWGVVAALVIIVLLVFVWRRLKPRRQKTIEEQLKEVEAKIAELRAKDAHLFIQHRRISDTNRAVLLKDIYDGQRWWTDLVDISGNILFEFGGSARVDRGSLPSATNVSFGDQVVAVRQEDDGGVSVVLPDQRVCRFNKRGKRIN